jgi:hypothetical protein
MTAALPKIPDAFEPHQYLSTACLHAADFPVDSPERAAMHRYCQSDTGQHGTKVPACCKFCQRPCMCACHTGGPA